MLQNDYEAFESFMTWLEEHNYCKVIHCCYCMKWNTYGNKYGKGWGYCYENCRLKHYDDWCSDAAEEAKERIMKHGKK